MTMASVCWVVSGGNAPNARGFIQKRIALPLVLHWDQSIVNGFGVNSLANTL
jgi:hypothetical protein